MFGKLDRRNMVKQLLVMIAFNILIALLLTIINFGHYFYENLMFAQCIGLSIFSIDVLARQWGLEATRLGDLGISFVALITGAVIGTLVALSLLGFMGSQDGNLNWQLFLQPVFYGLFFGSLIFYFFYSRTQIMQTQALVREQEILRLAREKELTEAQLKLIQAQIEPHFLFNTLANIASLIDHDAFVAKKMLLDLNNYLRTALTRTREGRTTLTQELDILKAYLSILQVRMGARLHYAFDISPGLEQMPLPPLLLQPLVENAVRHGLEPKVSGGEVRVSATMQENKLVLQVTDTGVGFAPQWHDGVGLSNIRARLEALYAGKAQFDISELASGGVKTVMQIPIEVMPK